MPERNNEDPPSQFHLFLARLLVVVVFTSAFIISWPVFEKMRERGWFPEPRIEISGFEPKESVAIERHYSFVPARRETQADKSGRAVFYKTGPGKWRVVKGGTEELRNTTIFIPDRHGVFTKKVGTFEITTIFRQGS
ncbi:MAG: hypothetical protein A2934_04370 [Candidatus Sungbacteria bacterium RIFCSPLOWO2_01_FULL_47_10]|uniref:Uncharacterized protein n=1 Tax=Candidatus Sungbacteria bacterium RIFCSPLOWO2_01_FULL_47_10 TaxID=1802276 RepID=A0A1G2L0Y2_9BACT|nr:MAG: hypothetical protein A2934_04370 [Candidatus Sungbacteria bacterium RIFCSPLOWO2_01_FULL_47_10]